MRVAVLGAGGTMGFPIARNLARAGMSVAAWNRSPDKAAALAGDGVRLADSAAAAAAGADVVLTMVSDAEAVIACMEGERGAANRHGQLGGLDPAQHRRRDRHRRVHPAGRGPRPAVLRRPPCSAPASRPRQGALVVLASGPASERDRAQPVFDIIGQ